MAEDKGKVVAKNDTRPVNAAEKFTQVVIKQFGSTVGEGIKLTDYQRRLAQHLFVKIDMSMKELEKKRLQRGKPGSPITWENVNMNALATSAMQRVELGLDALIPNHIHVIPYWNTAAGKYDIDLRVGYMGKDYYKRQMAVEPPAEIVYQLVHKKDKFRPIMQGFKNPVESYEFEIPEPFDRGEVVGGFAYLVYENERLNKLIIVSAAEFEKSRKKAGSDEFWGNYPDEMKYKTLVTRATKYLNIDPQKVNASYLAVEREEEVIDAEIVKTEIEGNANKGPVLDITEEQQKLDPAPAETQKEKEAPATPPPDEPKKEEEKKGGAPY